MAPILLLLIGLCIASIVVIITYVQPLMVARSDWFGILIVAYVFVAFGLFFYAWGRVHRWLGLRCPYCHSTFLYVDLPPRGVDPAVLAQMQSQCSRCQATLIDLNR